MKDKLLKLFNTCLDNPTFFTSEGEEKIELNINNYHSKYYLQIDWQDKSGNNYIFRDEAEKQTLELFPELTSAKFPPEEVFHVIITRFDEKPPLEIRKTTKAIEQHEGELTLIKKKKTRTKKLFRKAKEEEIIVKKAPFKYHITIYEPSYEINFGNYSTEISKEEFQECLDKFHAKLKEYNDRENEKMIQHYSELADKRIEQYKKPLE
jgi:hypothetical protein